MENVSELVILFHLLSEKTNDRLADYILIY